jgi:hypothetical protein
MVIPDEEAESEETANPICVKVKFYSDCNDPENSKIRVRFKRKAGDIIKFNKTLADLKEKVFADIWQLPRELMA